MDGVTEGYTQRELAFQINLLNITRGSTFIESLLSLTRLQWGKGVIMHDISAIWCVHDNKMPCGVMHYMELLINEFNSSPEKSGGQITNDNSKSIFFKENWLVSLIFDWSQFLVIDKKNHYWFR